MPSARATASIISHLLSDVHRQSQSSTLDRSLPVQRALLATAFSSALVVGAAARTAGSAERS